MAKDDLASAGTQAKLQSDKHKVRAVMLPCLRLPAVPHRSLDLPLPVAQTLTMKRKPAVVVDGMSEYERKNEQFLAESKLTQEVRALARHQPVACQVLSRPPGPQQLVRRDDVVLDEMHSGLSRLGSAAIDIRTELEGQSQLLDELGEEVDEAQSSLDRVMGQLHKLLKTKGARHTRRLLPACAHALRAADNCQIGIILLLTLVLVGMIALVVFL